MAGPPFYVLLGPDYAGKSATMAELARVPGRWRLVSVDEPFLGPDHALVSRLRRLLVDDALPALGKAFSVDFAMSLLQTAVVHLRDQVLAATEDGRPAVVDSYYYKILAKCRLAGGDNPVFAWWRSFPQPRRVLYLDVTPHTAWRRSRAGTKANRLEHYGDCPNRTAFTAFQADLRTAMLDEVSHLPVTMVGGRDGVRRIARRVVRMLAEDRG
jgi:thymidylate kinase